MSVNIYYPVTRWVYMAVALIGIGVLSVSCSTVDPVTGEGVYNIYTVQDEVSLGQNALTTNIKEFEQKGVPINQDAARVADLKQMVLRLAAVSDMPGLPYDVTLVHSNLVNAAALPGGQIIVFEGLYHPENGLTHSDDEIAAVLAHEMAHVNCRHSTERLSKIMTASILAETAAMVAEHNDENNWATAIRSIFAAGTSLIIPTYSRADEREADRVGLFYMAKAGFDPRAAARIWQRVYQKKGDTDPASIFSTHPSDYERYLALEQMMPYAMEEYHISTGHYPQGYTPPPTLPVRSFDWRRVN